MGHLVTGIDLSGVSDPVVGGRVALARGDWEAARELFDLALQAGESGVALEGLGFVGWWLGDAGLTLRSRERAYRAYRAAGDACSAGRVAAWLAADFLEFRNEDAVARGWFERAHRLLDGRPDCADQGWLAVHEGSFLLGGGDLDAAVVLAGLAVRLGRKLAVADLEAIGLALDGMALVRAGKVGEGMRRLDEASAVCAGEELELPVSAGWALCYLISACEGVGDLPRATQWCEAMREFTDRWGGRQLLGLCRSAYGRVLATGGEWEAAEVELTNAVRDLEASRPAMVAGGLVRLAELRARQGRADEARALFERAGSHRLAVLGLGALALDAGDPIAAADAADRVLRRLPEVMVLDRVPALELLVRARVALGELDGAAEACAEFAGLAEELATPYMRGRARLLAGEVAAARGDLERARRDFEDAIDYLTEAAAIHDAALARLELARALAALGRADRGHAEAHAAREVFSRLGATRDIERAEAPLPDADPSPGDGSAGELTSRELDVLRLVAQGLSDAEIAARLVVSQHTVHRHVANIRSKLRLPSRAAAVAYAARSGLL